MKRFFLFLLLALAAAGAVAYGARDSIEAPRDASSYRSAVIERGDIVSTVSATGTVTPTTTVIVGSQLSGQVVEILADYNSSVVAGQVLARLNRQQIEAKRDAARAELAQARANRMVQEAQTEKVRADILRAEAAARDMEAQAQRVATLLADAERIFERQEELKSRGIATEASYLTARTQRDAQRSQVQSSQAQIESAKAQVTALRAEINVVAAQKATSEAAVAQREAIVRQIEVDLANTEIRSPVDGVVVQRNIELGATVAASLTAPTLFLVAQDLRRIEIHANVDEADVGRVKAGQMVRFQVNAHPGRNFEGRVRQVRLGSQTVQNVVIYTTVIDVDNPELDLMPGMTATLRVMAEERRDVLRVANAALRWRPPSEKEPAQDDSAAGPFAERQDGAGEGQGSLLQRLRGELALSEEQAEAIRGVLARGRGQRDIDAPAEAPFEGAEGNGRRGGRQFRQQMMAEIEGLLNADQKAKFRSLRQAAVRGGRRGPPATGLAGRVYLIGQDGEPVRTPVRLGASDGTHTEIISGTVEPGQRAITGGGNASRPAGSRPFRLGF